mmetsp:Transcript_16052/g.28831  ORF Transcript_16052/g.28831 Transcript_16052/m.28831 type:complete len:207 (+) Transcript_16052:991-1611(+)
MREHQRRPGVEPMCLHCQGKRGFVGDDDSVDDGGGHRHDPFAVEVPSRHKRSGRRAGHRYFHDAGGAASAGVGHGHEAAGSSVRGSDDASDSCGGGHLDVPARRFRGSPGSARHRQRRLDSPARGDVASFDRRPGWVLGHARAQTGRNNVAHVGYRDLNEVVRFRLSPRQTPLRRLRGARAASCFCSVDGSHWSHDGRCVEENAYQ